MFNTVKFFSVSSSSCSSLPILECFALPGDDGCTIVGIPESSAERNMLRKLIEAAGFDCRSCHLRFFDGVQKMMTCYSELCLSCLSLHSVFAGSSIIACIIVAAFRSDADAIGVRIVVPIESDFLELDSDAELQRSYLCLDCKLDRRAFLMDASSRICLDFEHILFPGF
jgi:hypothetical protein